MVQVINQTSDQGVEIELRSTVRLSPVEIGRWLANADSDSQAEVLNAMGEEMASWGSYKSEMQTAYLRDDLNAFGRLLVKDIAYFLENGKHGRAAF